MSSSDNGISTDGSGILVGVQPAQPQTSASVNVRPDQAVTQPVRVVEQPPQQPNPFRYTEEDVTRARQEEQHRVNERLEDVTAQLQLLQQERQAELAERQRQIDESNEALKAEEENEMEIRDLLARREAEFNAQINEINSRYETDRAIFERERALVEAQRYRIERIEQESENIMPELRDLVYGDSPEQVDASIEEMKARSAAIWENMQQAMQPQPFRGAASPSLPPIGPMEQLPQMEQLTPDDIKNMDMDTYKRYRQQLLQATSPRNRGRG
jgi:DNA repair exonuclease SbcCD ATPase subunit